jgi:hypothetical protein
MKTKLAFGLAMLSVAFSFSPSFACPESSQTTASIVESTVSESGLNVTAPVEASAPEGQIVEVDAPGSVAPTEPSAPSAASSDAIPIEITEIVTVVVPGQDSEDIEGPAMPASGVAGIEPSVTEASSQTAAPESETRGPPISLSTNPRRPRPM